MGVKMIIFNFLSQCGYESVREATYLDIALDIKPFGAKKTCESVVRTVLPRHLKFSPTFFSLGRGSRSLYHTRNAERDEPGKRGGFRLNFRRILLSIIVTNARKNATLTRFDFRDLILYLYSLTLLRISRG